MAPLEGSVGFRGENRPDDVREVQRLLNRHDLGAAGPVPESGVADRRTVEGIRRFQTVFVGMSSPDGRVDPGGRTLRRMSSGSPNAPLPRIASSPETRQEDRELRRKLVGPSVRETALTTQILDGLIPPLSKIRARVISGWLSDTDLFWKVNYHWEYLLDMVEHCLTLAVDARTEEELSQLRSSLRSAPPDPPTGYLSSPLGKPEDRSTMADFERRYRLVSAGKRELKALDQRAGLRQKSRRTAKAFDYAVAPVAPPGKSKHSTGYALDIEGDNPAIKGLCERLGATLVFDEKSHMHVEFKNGISR